jgi:predicted nucleic acid-binding protein
MTIVTNTGPLVILAKIDQLGLLQQMFSSVAIPPAVHRELLAKSSAEVSRLDAALMQFIEVVAEPKLPPAVKIVTNHLDAGEQQAIALAYARNTTLIIDERLGRQAARQLGLTVTGSTGILIEAKRRGHIQSIRPLLEAAREQGYWLSDELITIATKLAGEAS